MISAKRRYTLRVMIDLTEHGGEGYIPLKEVAEWQEIPKKYLEIIIEGLIKEKILIELGGCGGEYKLCRRPGEYPVGEILELMEGSLTTAACLSKNADPCSGAATCKTLPIRAEFDKMVHDYLYGKTLEDSL